MQNTRKAEGKVSKDKASYYYFAKYCFLHSRVVISWMAISIWVMTAAVLLLNCRALCLGSTSPSGTGLGRRARLERLFNLIWLTALVLAGSRDLNVLRTFSCSVSGLQTVVAPILFWPLGTLPSLLRPFQERLSRHWRHSHRLGLCVEIHSLQLVHDLVDEGILPRSPRPSPLQEALDHLPL